MSALSTDELDSFERDGFLVRRAVIDGETVAAVRGSFESAVDQLAMRWLDEGHVSSDHGELSFERRYSALRAEMPARFPISWRRILVSRPVWQLWQHPALLEPARQLIGDPVRAHGIWNGRPREPRNRVQSIGWHQDANYERDFDESALPVVSCWVPLVPIDEENAPLQFLAGSNAGGVLPTGPSPDTGNILIEIAAHELPEAPAVTLDDLAPGDVVLFGNRTVHRALQNSTTDRTRWSIDIRFSADVQAQRDRDPRGYRLFDDEGRLAPEPFEVWADRHGYSPAEQLAELGMAVDPDSLGALAKAVGVSASDFEVF